jgi:hypothetical protein
MTTRTRSSIGIDFAKGRFDHRAVVPVTASELNGIVVGDTIDVKGDHVGTRPAVVRDVDKSKPRRCVAAMVTFDFLD